MLHWYTLQDESNSPESSQGEARLVPCTAQCYEHNSTDRTYLSGGYWSSPDKGQN